MGIFEFPMLEELDVEGEALTAAVKTESGISNCSKKLRSSCVPILFSKSSASSNFFSKSEFVSGVRPNPAELRTPAYSNLFPVAFQLYEVS